MGGEGGEGGAEGKADGFRERAGRPTAKKAFCSFLALFTRYESVSAGDFPIPGLDSLTTFQVI